jgi:FtsZ-interacting cell division protein ZipA
MGELRFILLLAGLVFLVALAAWEMRKPRQAQGDAALRDGRRSEPSLGTLGDAGVDLGAAGATGAGTSARSAPLAHAELPAGRRPLSAPPRIDLPELEAVRAESILADADAIHEFETYPVSAPPSPAEAATDAERARDEAAAPGEATRDEPAIALSAPSAEASGAAATAATAAAATAAGATASAGAVGTAATLGSSATLAAPPAPGGPPQILVDWPPEGERHIVSLRIVPASNERLSGRAVRLAITACGFVHGRFGIYHQPDSEGRALLSIASLNKPGILDPVNMDFQRLSGISLFAVLPGPLAPGAALDHLLEIARELSQRLPARVQDESGHPLDAARLEDMRERMQSLTGPGLHAHPAA